MIHAIIVPAAIKDASNEAAHLIGVDPEGLMTTLCVPLVPDDGPDDAAATALGVLRENQRIREGLARGQRQQLPRGDVVAMGSGGPIAGFAR